MARLSGARTDAPIVETAVSGQLTETVDVEAGLARLTLVALHDDPNLDAHLLRPGGAPARASDPDVEHVDESEAGLSLWAISDPRPGRWTLLLRGEGPLLVWRDVVPQARDGAGAYRIEVSEVPTHVLTDEPLTIDVSLREDGGGTRITTPTLKIVGQVRRAGFAEAVHVARDDGMGCDATPGDGHHCLALSGAPAGACTLLLRALLEGDEVARRELAFEVVPPPTSTPSPSPEPSPPPPPAIAATPSPRRRAALRASWPFLLAGLIALVGLGGGGVVLLRRRREPTLGGRLRVLAAPSSGQIGRVIDLPAQSSVVVGPGDKRSVSLPGATARFRLRALRNPEGEAETWVVSLSERDDGALALNDRPLTSTRRLRDGDVLTLGAYRLRYEDLRQASLRRARRRPRRQKLRTGGVR